MPETAPDRVRPGRWLRRLGGALLLAVAVAPLGLHGPLLPVGATSATAEWSGARVRIEPAPGETLVVEGLGEYRGAVEVVRHGAGLAVVNEVGLDDYLRGVAEVPASWPMEALEAQAVAARSYALHVAAGTRPSASRAVGADICATQACQVYRGVARERQPHGDRWLAAVAATSGQVLVHGGAPIRASYGSSNGGFSEAGGRPYLPPVEDPHDLAVSPWARWRASWALADVAAAFPGAGDLVEVNRAGEVLVLRRRQPDGTIVDEGLSGAAARAAFNARLPSSAGLPVALPSRRFVAWTEDDTVIVEGAGFGHLTGMSQYGALGKAQQGWTSDDILAAYYGGLRPVTLDPVQLPGTIRVAVGDDLASVAVNGAGRYRVTADDGRVLSHLASGRWELRPGPHGVAAVPPTGQDGPGGVGLTAPRPDLVRVELAVPAHVALLDAEGALVADLGVLDAGPHDVALTRPVPPGSRLELLARADAGAGRVVTASLTIAPPLHERAAPALRTAARSAAAGPGGPDDPSDPTRPGAASLAVGLLAAAVAGLVRTGAAARIGRTRATQ